MIEVDPNSKIIDAIDKFETTDNVKKFLKWALRFELRGNLRFSNEYDSAIKEHYKSERDE